jgi:hypothetical protein
MASSVQINQDGAAMHRKLAYKCACASSRTPRWLVASADLVTVLDCSMLSGAMRLCQDGFG